MKNDSGKRTEQNDYLWDGSGEPDPEIQKLEGVLKKYRHDRPPAGDLGQYLSGGQTAKQSSARTGRWLRFWEIRMFPAAATAFALLVIAVGGYLFYVKNRRVSPGPGWDVASLAGTPKIGRKIIQGNDSHWTVGQLLETDSRSRASLKADGVGQIEIDPDTRLRLLTMGELKRIALDRGTLHAFIWSPPGEFVVDTPSATTVDLGCAYTLQVDDSGAGTVRTTLGWVGFKLNGRESFIPAGAACATRPKIGPGTPYFEDASEEFRRALSRFDFGDGVPQQQEDLKVILAQSRKRDALTLWHLLSRVDGSQREQVYERLTELVPPPAGVTKDGILHLDQKMLDQWWNSLGFDDISVWRRWEHSWSGAEKGKK